MAADAAAPPEVLPWIDLKLADMGRNPWNRRFYDSTNPYTFTRGQHDELQLKCAAAGPNGGDMIQLFSVRQQYVSHATMVKRGMSHQPIVRMFIGNSSLSDFNENVVYWGGGTDGICAVTLTSWVVRPADHLQRGYTRTAWDGRLDEMKAEWALVRAAPRAESASGRPWTGAGPGEAYAPRVWSDDRTFEEHRPFIQFPIETKYTNDATDEQVFLNVRTLSGLTPRTPDSVVRWALHELCRKPIESTQPRIKSDRGRPDLHGYVRSREVIMDLCELEPVKFDKPLREAVSNMAIERAMDDFCERWIDDIVWFCCTVAEKPKAKHDAIEVEAQAIERKLSVLTSLPAPPIAMGAMALPPPPMPLDGRKRIEAIALVRQLTATRKRERESKNNLDLVYKRMRTMDVDVEVDHVLAVNKKPT